MARLRQHSSTPVTSCARQPRSQPPILRGRRRLGTARAGAPPRRRSPAEAKRQRLEPDDDIEVARRRQTHERVEEDGVGADEDPALARLDPPVNDLRRPLGSGARDRLELGDDVIVRQITLQRIGVVARCERCSS
jgi:hypothetical protein